MKQIIRLILLSLSIMALFSCNKEIFSPQQLETIGSPDMGIMRLWTIDNRSDSLFLRLQAAPLTREQVNHEAFKTLCTRMLQTVQNPENEGVGIAAPQVGVSLRLVAVQRFDKAGEPFEFYVNPQIDQYSQTKADGGEGCLSVPNRRGTVNRSTAIELSYTDTSTMERKSEKVEGFTAVIFQHEIDHLDGIIYIDRLIDELQTNEPSGEELSEE